MWRVVIDDQMQLFAFGCGAINQAQELQPLLMAMLRHAGGNDLAIKSVQRRKESGRPITLVVMSNRTGSSFLQGQTWLRSI